MKAVFLASQKTGMTLDNYKNICEENGIEFVLTYTTDHDEIVEMSRDTDVFLTSVTPLPAELIQRLDGRVKGLVRIAIGYDIIDVEAASKRGMLVCNIPDYGIEEVAVHAMTLILSIIKKVPLYDKAIRQGQWTKQVLMLGHTPRRLSTLTLGLLGFGHIAKKVAQYAKGFGMKVVAADPYIPEEVFTELGVKKLTNEELYESADVISVHVPLFKETHHLINRESIEKMKDGVFIVNTARGPLVSETDLVEALKAGKVAAAGLDVFEEEPISDPNRELLQLDNVVITPHIAYHSKEGFEDLQRKACITAVALCKGEMPYNAVNKTAVANGVTL